jgi:organic hydroperoxide reductase OsmC/OhrA
MAEVESNGVSVSLAREEGFRFRVRFGAEGVTMVTDEPPPLGAGSGPNPSALLAAAVGNCLASSLLFCMQKRRLEVGEFPVEVRTTTVRNAEGRMRIGEIRVCLAPTVTPDVRAQMGRCLELFESFCVVTESVRAGIEVKVAVEPRITGAGAPDAVAPEPAPCALIGGG